MLPTFMIAGTFPSGTGHLFALLEQHPEVFLQMPMAPECNFFFKSHAYAKGLEHYEATYFRDYNGEAAAGERSSLVMCGGDKVAGRIAEHLPNIKLIFLLRDPVARAWANYRFTALSGFEELEFGDALDAEAERTAATTDPFWSEILPHAYFARGCYADQLAPFLERFSRDQLLIMRSDALIRDEPAALRRITEFLGVSTDFTPDPRSDFSTPSVVSPARQAELRELHGAALDPAIQRVRERLEPQNEVDREVFANVAPKRAPLPDAIRQRLASAYAPHNERLKPLVEFDISDWGNP